MPAAFGTSDLPSKTGSTSRDWRKQPKTIIKTWMSNWLLSFFISTSLLTPPLPRLSPPSLRHRCRCRHPTHTQVYCTAGSYQFFTTIISAPRAEGYINLTRLSGAGTPARRRREPDPVLLLSNHFPTSIFAVRIHPGWQVPLLSACFYLFFPPPYFHHDTWAISGTASGCACGNDRRLSATRPHGGSFLHKCLWFVSLKGGFCLRVRTPAHLLTARSRLLAACSLHHKGLKKKLQQCVVSE